jgi:hypothetical protein
MSVNIRGSGMTKAQWRSYAKTLEAEGAAMNETHREYAKKVEKQFADDTAKLREENANLKLALSEILPVLRRLLDWRIESPLA